jgi:phospholipase/carboxylesterase
MGQADDLAPFAKSLGVAARFHFPDGVVDLAPQGRRGRAWWLTEAGGDVATVEPAGLASARVHLARTVKELMAPAGASPLVLGGFSQGAMLACDVALRTSLPVEGLVMFSGGPIAVDAWRERYHHRQGLRAFVAHGTSDTELSFDAADSLRRELAQAGLDVTWVPFEGGHEIPLVVWRSFKRWLTSARSA